MSDDHPLGLDKIADLALRREWMVGAAESLTSGQLAAVLGWADSASRWFAGAVIAYRPEVKFELLKIPQGPVITARCARQMAAAAVSC